MNTQANKPLHLPLLVGGIAAILVSGIAIASLAISGQGFNGISAPAEPAVAAPAVEAPAVAASSARYSRCAECGVIVSTREVEVSADKHGVDASGRIALCTRSEIGRNSVRKHEITVRLKDGSMRVITDAKPAKWIHGEAVTIIAGLD